MAKKFGDILKDWRQQRRLSQLDLGLCANVSARHISFLETGRSNPSRLMVMLLCEQLDLPRTIRNALLTAAGFAPVFTHRNLDDADMTHIRQAVEWTLSRHDPYPAIALDRHWLLLRANKSATFLFGALGVQVNDSFLDIITDDARMSQVIENWPEVAHHLMVRLRTENAHYGGDDVLNAAATKLASYVQPVMPEAGKTLPAVIPIRYRFGDQILSLFSTISQFGTAEDLSLSDMKIELNFPADDFTKNQLEHMFTEVNGPLE